MLSSGHPRRVILFLAAIIIPSVTLIALSLRMIAQERELVVQRLADDRRRQANEIRQELLVRLERIKRQAVSALATRANTPQAAYDENPALALVCWVEENRLVLPWEENGAAQEFRRLVGADEFARQISQGEREEYERGQFGKAAELYRGALDSARHPLQGVYARLLLARALAKAGRRSEADAHYSRIVVVPAEWIDEQGIPLSLYAAAPLIEAGSGYSQVLGQVQATMKGAPRLSPTAMYLLRDLAGMLAEKAPAAAEREAARNLLPAVIARIRYLEQVLALQDDFPNLLPARASGELSRNREPLWVPYGEDSWLLSLAPPLAGQRAAAVVVSAKSIFGSLDATQGGANHSPGEVRIVAGSDSTGETLGESLPGLRAVFLGRENSGLTTNWNLQQSFYFIALVLVLSMTLVGAYLLWRDVRRELRLAELRSQFVSSVSHELKTPLTAIRMFAETLQAARLRDTQTEREYLDTIVNESERLTRLLNNVLDFSKVERSQKSYRLEPTSLADIVRAAARAVQYPLAQQGFDLRVDIENDTIAVRADRDALEQAVLNLLTNAMKYSGEHREIDLRVRTQDDHGVVQVTDRGVGIAAKEQARIFEKFYRVQTPENRHVPGAGLGLALVAHIAEAHGGHVQVRSAPGEGSTFSIHLPLESGA